MIKKYLAFFSLILVLPVLCFAVSTTLVISEIKARGPSGASDEFIELKNISASPIDLGDYEIVYSSAGGSAPSNRVSWTAGTFLPAGKTYLCANQASSTYASIADILFSSGPADSGQLGIRKLSDLTIVDGVAFGVITLNVLGEGTPHPGTFSTGSTAHSIERLPVGVNNTDTDNNASDFTIQMTPTPTPLGAPKLSNHLRSPFVPNAAESATVSAVILATGGNTITGATVSWDLDNVAQTPIGMTSVGSTYSATIPGQSDQSVIEYLITGYDSATNSISIGSGYIVGTTLISVLRQVDGNGVPIYEGLAARARGNASVSSGGSFVTGNNLSIFMQDTSGILGASGIDIFTRSSAYNINIGDTLVVEGDVTNFNGLLELEVSTTAGQGQIDNVGSGTPPNSIILPSVSSLNESYEGLLVTIADVYSTFTSPTTSSLNYTFYRGGNPGLLGTLRILNTPNEVIGQFPPSYPVRVTGIVSQSDFATPYFDFYQLIPRSSADFNSSLVVNPEADLNVNFNETVNLTVTGGTPPYNWTVVALSGGSGTLDNNTSSSVVFTVGTTLGTVYVTVQDSTGTPLVGSTGIFTSSPTSAPIHHDIQGILIQDNRELDLK